MPTVERIVALRVVVVLLKLLISDRRSLDLIEPFKKWNISHANACLHVFNNVDRMGQIDILSEHFQVILGIFVLTLI